VPSNALITSAVVLSIGALLSYVLPDTAFSIVTTISAICFIWVWSIILIAHLIYLKKRPDLHRKSKFKAPLAPFINYVVLLLFAAIIVIMFVADETRPALLLTPVWFIILFFWYGMRNQK
ncbi:amino acid permease, partial [Butyricicoccus sp. 1XD8-22]